MGGRETAVNHAPSASENGHIPAADWFMMPPMGMPPHDVCYRAIATRDARFDGRLFIGVKTTGIYCRPICPARTPKRENVTFWPSAAAAQEAGFRPCLRCRPEISPDAAAWRGTSNTVSRALALIAEGGLDGEEASLANLCGRLGVGERQLRRLFDKHLGAPPVAVAQTRRVLFAKQLIQETRLPMAAVADAAGFGSIRRFNDAFQKLYRRSPSELRRQGPAAMSSVTLRLGYRAPYDWDAILAFLGARAIAGVELVEKDRYTRTIEIDGVFGSIQVGPGRGCLEATIRFPRVTALLAVVARLRRLFDLDADIQTIGAHLAGDSALAPLIARRPGLRTPGAWCGFELAVRAILGQQITVTGARRLAVRIVELAGSDIAPDASGDERLARVFPSAARMAAADLSSLGMPRARIAALGALAQAVAADPKLIEPAGSYEETIAKLLALPGFGPWTAQYWARRALRDSDAFPAADVALLRSPLVAEKGRRPTPKALLARAESWRPWRAYAAQHLWTADAEPA
jgi:AraC family transcriptional regulator of adaptative response / DNA-3-methyladenine glycosylase II